MKIQTSKINAEIYKKLKPVLDQPLPPSIVKDKNEEDGSLDSDLNKAVCQALGLSFLVYEPLKHAETQLEVSDYTDVLTLSHWYSGAQCICAVKEGRAFVSFRGSVSLLDWIVDFLIIPFYWPLRHFGFETSWRSVRGEVRKWLEDNKEKIKTVTLCGHSLGGGMAHVAAFNLAPDYEIANVITFGAPKASFLGTARRYENTKIKNTDIKLGKITHTVVNQRDIVAKVPFAMIGYRDVGNLVYIDKNCDVYGGAKAISIRENESMGDVDYLLGMFSEEKTDPFMMHTYVDPKMKGWDAFYYYLKKGVRELNKHAPYLAMPIIPPLLYILFSSYFMRSGLSHLTGKYVSAFYTDPNNFGFVKHKPSKLKVIVGTTIRIVLGAALLGGFAFGLYKIAQWSLSEFNKPQQEMQIPKINL